ncbi:hypothetical protein R0K17_09525 [Planococcus sp. SIMBA_143]
MEQHMMEIERLKSVKNSIEKGIEEIERKELLEMLQIVVKKVKKSDPEFEANSFDHELNGHWENFYKKADIYLNKFYSDIAFIMNQMKMDKLNTKVCLKMLNKMIETDLYMEYVRAYIKASQRLQEGQYETLVIRLSERDPGEYPSDLGY